MQTKREPVLCYVKDGLAYFTTQALQAQDGDDWDDVPYETNAGLPSPPSKKGRGWSILVYSYKGTYLETPAELSGSYTPYSVQDINAGAVAWLYGNAKGNGRRIAIYAGETLPRFKRLVKQAGGSIEPAGEVGRDYS